MRTVTSQFLAALPTSHRRAVRVDSHLGASLLYSGLPITDGSVTADRGRDVRYSLSLTVGDVALLPRDADDPLAPYGQRLHAFRGITYTDGTTEVVPCGVYVITQTSGDRDIGPISIQADGLESVLQAAKLTLPWSTAGQIGHFEVISALILDVMPDAVVDDRTTGDFGPASRTWDVDSDRWAACRELASAIGAEVYCDAAGTFVVADLPPLPEDATPVWDVAAGTGGVMVSAVSAYSLSGVYNGVRAAGENAADAVAPVSYLAVDADPASPTRWGGPIGKRPMTIKSPLLTTLAACESAAEFALRDALGPNATVSLKAVPNPALEPGDCIRVVYVSGDRELHTVQSVSIPLTSGEYSISTLSAKEETP